MLAQPQADLQPELGRPRAPATPFPQGCDAAKLRRSELVMVQSAISDGDRTTQTALGLRAAFEGMPPMKKKQRAALEAIVDLVEEQLSKYAPEERERRIAAAESRIARFSRTARGRVAKPSRTVPSRVRNRSSRG